MKQLTKFALATLFAAALLPAAHAYHEIDHIMPTLGWEDEDWLEDFLDNIMPVF